jgi:hypothetical protein
MTKRFRRLNRKRVYRSFAGQLGAHQKLIANTYLADGTRTFLADKLRYMLKSPRKAYRIYRAKRVTSDGELVRYFRQSKSDVRKGDSIAYFHLLKNLSLDELAAAGGEGTGMLCRIVRRVRADGHFGC